MKFSRGAGGAVAARLVPQLIEHGHMVTGTHMSPRNAERGGAPGAEPTALSQSQAWAWRHVAGNS